MINKNPKKVGQKFQRAEVKKRQVKVEFVSGEEKITKSKLVCRDMKGYMYSI